MNKNPNNIKLVAVDMDGTFLRNDQTYDQTRFDAIYERMKASGCRFVVASGNQYYQLRSFFPDTHTEMSFVAENGALVKDEADLLFAADISDETIETVVKIDKAYPEIENVMCGLESAYCERGAVRESFFEVTNLYYHHLNWVDDFFDVDDQILKFAPTVPVDKTWTYFDIFEKELDGLLVPTSSGHGSIDLIVPGCHKASGLDRLVDRWGISPDQCVGFGDGGNDIEMLEYCGLSYAMANAPDEVKAVADKVCPSNNEDGVLEILEMLFPA